MATRHLYETEDVVASILYGGLCSGDANLVWNAFRELHASGEYELLQNTAFLLWMLSSPEHPHEAARCATYARGSYSEFAMLLSTGAVKGDLPALRTADDYAQPPTVIHVAAAASGTSVPEGYSADQIATVLAAVHYALKHKYWQHAHHILGQFLDAHTDWLCTVLETLGALKPLVEQLKVCVYAPLADCILAHSLASCCASSMDAFVPDKKMATAWKASMSMRKGRAWSVPAEALALWKLRSKSRLGDTAAYIADDDSCAYWKQACAKYGARKQDDRLVFESDQAQEEFYAVYFADDIPDEWPLAERNKSHTMVVEPTIEKNHWIAAFHLCWS